MKRKNLLMKQKGLIVRIVITVIIVSLLLLILPYLHENWYLKNDKEIVNIEFNQNVAYANSLTIESYGLGNIGTKYVYRFDRIYPKNNEQKSVISLYIMKRLPDSDSITCSITFKNGSKDECKYSLPDNTFPNDGFYSPINIEYSLPEEGSDIVLEYKCTKCNPGAFELQIEQLEENPKTNIFHYFFNVHVDGFTIENIHEENTKTNNTYRDGSTIHFEGDKTTFKSGRINTISYRIIARNFMLEILYWLSISVMAGIVLYWIERIFRRWE